MSHCGRCSFICSPFDSSGLKKPSNETLLCVAFVSFMGFTTVQSVVALIAKSEAMMGDSAAMAVDALTYGFNLYAERKKNEDSGIAQVHGTEEVGIELNAASIGDGTNTTTHLAEKVKLERQLQRRRRHLHLELVPPLMSVSILMVVIGFVLQNSVHTLVLDAHRSEKEQARPNLILMTTFSSLNLLVDVVNVTCFARAKHLMGYNTNDNMEKKGAQEYDVIDNSDEIEGDNGALFEVHGSIPVENGSDVQQQLDDSSNSITSNEHVESEENDEDERMNLNMCSAYTHVFADTLRSIAVIIASVIAQTVESVTPEVADATAAVIVSFIILVSVLPLARGLFHTWRELRSITRKEHALSKNDFEGEVN
mmetsp:Transcript_29200/g.62092  ORF Transcript_29200/g.62092 Transcript_29200/m.62092 type:complete len:367 (-) Transcript_29200:183-1283(-)|eukprot:CAMPEP_0172313804 /NCGR_PEP_ID=MMETSP1058-20130122/21006_1 /TAXON_ID=83371 /ORGANISM="Detonula confervacea, Strain CCMP 353" /LENGTH=366 /DNA_ID=CAMNT_0013027515 /DNA_START=117 /DNA_END=1217 /DNA_ORIENTATION=-